MQMATAIETDNGEMIVKRVSVPIGLEELMEGLTKEVILKKPKDMYVFASEYFAKLLELRDKGRLKGMTIKRAQSVTKRITKEYVKPQMVKKSASVEPIRQLPRQTSIRSESNGKLFTAKKITLSSKEDKSRAILDKHKARKGSKDSITNDNKPAKEPEGNISNRSGKKTPLSRDRSTSSTRKGKSGEDGNVKTPRQRSLSKSEKTPRASVRNWVSKDENQSKKDKDIKDPKPLLKHAISMAEGIDKIGNNDTIKSTDQNKEIISEGTVDKMTDEQYDMIKDVQTEDQESNTIREIQTENLKTEVEQIDKKLSPINETQIEREKTDNTCIGCSVKDDGAIDMIKKDSVETDEIIDNNKEKMEASEKILHSTDSKRADDLNGQTITEVEDNTNEKMEDAAKKTEAVDVTDLKVNKEDNLNQTANKEDTRGKTDSKSLVQDSAIILKELDKSVDNNGDNESIEMTTEPSAYELEKDSTQISQNDGEISTEKDNIENKMAKTPSEKSKDEGQIDEKDTEMIEEGEILHDREIAEIPTKPKQTDEKLGSKIINENEMKGKDETDHTHSIIQDSAITLNEFNQNIENKSDNENIEMKTELNADKLEKNSTKISQNEGEMSKSSTEKDNIENKTTESPSVKSNREEQTDNKETTEVEENLHVNKIAEISTKLKETDEKLDDEVVNENELKGKHETDNTDSIEPNKIELQENHDEKTINEEEINNLTVVKETNMGESDNREQAEVIPNTTSENIKVEDVTTKTTNDKTIKGDDKEPMDEGEGAKTLVKDEKLESQIQGSSESSNTNTTQQIVTENISDEIKPAIEDNSNNVVQEIPLGNAEVTESLKPETTSLMDEASNKNEEKKDDTEIKTTEKVATPEVEKVENSEKAGHLMKPPIPNLNKNEKIVKPVERKQSLSDLKSKENIKIKNSKAKSLSQEQLKAKSAHNKTNKSKDEIKTKRIKSVESSKRGTLSRTTSKNKISTDDKLKDSNKSEKDTEAIKNEADVRTEPKTRSKRSIEIEPPKEDSNTSNFDASKLREELKAVEDISKSTNFKSAYNPYILRQEIKNASQDSTKGNESKMSKVVSEATAALKIQSLWRGFKTRKHIKTTKNERGVVKLEESPRTDDNKTGIEEQVFESDKLAEMPKSAELKGEETKEEVKVPETNAMANAVLKIQTLWRGFRVRKHKKRGEVFGNTIDSQEINKETLKTVVKNDKKRAAAKIQALWRGYKVRKNITDVNTRLAELQKPGECDELNRGPTDEAIFKAASKIQAGVRGYIVRKKRNKTNLNSITEENSEQKLTDEDIVLAINQLDQIPEDSPKKHAQIQRSVTVDEPKIIPKSIGALSVDSARPQLEKLKTNSIDNDLVESNFVLQDTAENNRSAGEVGEITAANDQAGSINQTAENKTTGGSNGDNKKDQNSVEFIASDSNSATANNKHSNSVLIDDSISNGAVNKADPVPPQTINISYEEAPTRPVTSDDMPVQEQKNAASDGKNKRAVESIGSDPLKSANKNTSVSETEKLINKINEQFNQEFSIKDPDRDHDEQSFKDNKRPQSMESSTSMDSVNTVIFNDVDGRGLSDDQQEITSDKHDGTESQQQQQASSEDNKELIKNQTDIDTEISKILTTGFTEIDKKNKFTNETHADENDKKIIAPVINNGKDNDVETRQSTENPEKSFDDDSTINEKDQQQSSAKFDITKLRKELEEREKLLHSEFGPQDEKNTDNIEQSATEMNKMTETDQKIESNNKDVKIGDDSKNKQDDKNLDAPDVLILSKNAEDKTTVVHEINKESTTMQKYEEIATKSTGIERENEQKLKVDDGEFAKSKTENETKEESKVSENNNAMDKTPEVQFGKEEQSKIETMKDEFKDRNKEIEKGPGKNLDDEEQNGAIKTVEVSNNSENSQSTVKSTENVDTQPIITAEEKMKIADFINQEKNAIFTRTGESKSTNNEKVENTDCKMEEDEIKKQEISKQSSNLENLPVSNKNNIDEGQNNEDTEPEADVSKRNLEVSHNVEEQKNSVESDIKDKNSEKTLNAERTTEETNQGDTKEDNGPQKIENEDKISVAMKTGGIGGIDEKSDEKKIPRSEILEESSTIKEHTDDPISSTDNSVSDEHLGVSFEQKLGDNETKSRNELKSAKDVAENDKLIKNQSEGNTTETQFSNLSTLTKNINVEEAESGDILQTSNGHDKNKENIETVKVDEKLNVSEIDSANLNNQLNTSQSSENIENHDKTKVNIATKGKTELIRQETPSPNGKKVKEVKFNQNVGIIPSNGKSSEEELEQKMESDVEKTKTELMKIGNVDDNNRLDLTKLAHEIEHNKQTKEMFAGEEQYKSAREETSTPSNQKTMVTDQNFAIISNNEEHNKLDLSKLEEEIELKSPENSLKPEEHTNETASAVAAEIDNILDKATLHVHIPLSELSDIKEEETENKSSSIDSVEELDQDKKSIESQEFDKEPQAEPEVEASISKELEQGTEDKKSELGKKPQSESEDEASLRKESKEGTEDKKSELGKKLQSGSEDEASISKESNERTEDKNSELGKKPQSESEDEISISKEPKEGTEDKKSELGKKQQAESEDKASISKESKEGMEAKKSELEKKLEAENQSKVEESTIILKEEIKDEKLTEDEKKANFLEIDKNLKTTDAGLVDKSNQDSKPETEEKSTSEAKEIGDKIVSEEVVDKTISKLEDKTRINSAVNNQEILKDSESKVQPVVNLHEATNEITTTKHTDKTVGKNKDDGENKTETGIPSPTLPQTTTISLIHSGEFHDTITVPISVSPPTRAPSTGEDLQRSPPPPLAHTGELHDNVLPVSVQLNQAPPAGAAILTSHGPKSVSDDDADDAAGAQASDKDASTCAAQSDNTPSPSASMETEKRNNASVQKKSMEAEAATKIQAGFRGYQVRKQLKNKKSSPGDISSQRRSARRKSSGRVTDSGRMGQGKAKAPSDLEEKSAVKIQAGVRGFLVRRRQQKKQKPGKEAS